MKTSSFSYTARGETDVETKANGNTVDFDYYLDGLVASQIEKKSNGTLVSQHAMEYSANGHRIKDTAKVQNADNHAAYLENVFAYTFDPLDRVAKVEKKDAAGTTVQSTESYTHDAAGNVVAQTLKNVSATFAYDRNRLLTATSAGATASYTYDPFGRLSQVSSAGKVIERNTYDGYDRIVKHRKLQDDGTTKTTDTSYDALDRTSSKVEGTKTTNYSYLGLSGEVLSEEVAGKITSSYQYSPWGSRLSQVKFKADGTSEDSYYGYNPHSDVETLTSESGDTRSTYGYTAYGKNDEDRFTGVDKPEAQTPDQEPYNVYRFNAKRWDESSQSYDMGFRDYSPGLNRFLTRDAYAGALADLNLSTDPWNGNRYAFAGGNPISRVEADGHINFDPGSGGGGIYAHDLELCPDCHLDFTGDHPEVVGDPPKDPTGDIAKDLGHFVLDLGGLVPGAGELADGLNCGWYGAEGDATNAAFSCAAAAPGLGWGSTLTKWGFKAGDDALDVGKAAETCFKSFSGETEVEMGDGSRKPISEIEIGDEVLATDPETGERGPRKVTHLWIHSDTLTDLELEGGEILTTTEDHPFWNATDHEYQRADQLGRGDQLLTSDGRLVRVVGLRAGSQRVTTAYNLTVEGIHTYYVVAGASAVLVHNCGGLADPWQVADRVSGAADGHIWKNHGPGTPAVSKRGTASKFGANTSPEDVIDAVMAGVNKNTYRGPGDLPGTHYHLHNTGVDGFGTVDGTPTSWIKIFVDDAGALGSAFPVLN